MDTHVCNKCQLVLIGLNSYVRHRTSGDCRDVVTAVSCPPQGFTGGKWVPPRIIAPQLTSTVPTRRSENETSGNLESIIGSLYLRCCGVTLSSDIEVIRHKLSLTHRTSRIASHGDNEHDLEVIETKSAKLFPFICKSCKFYATRMSAFVWHLNSTSHSEKNSSFQIECKRCSTVCKSVSSLLKHLWKEKTALKDRSSFEGPLFVSQRSITKIQCSKCHLKFKTRFALINHERKAHSTVEKSITKEIFCDICKLEFSSKSTLRLHKKRHMPIKDRPFKCSECDFAFCERKELVMHSKVHSLEKEFVCKECDHRTRSIFSLRKHQKVHSNIKPFKCKLCPFECKVSSNLTRHVRIHSGSKPYSCPYKDCDFKTATQENLRKHILKGKKHEGMTVYTCCECNFGTNKFSEFRSHLNSSHKSLAIPSTSSSPPKNVSSIFSMNFK